MIRKLLNGKSAGAFVIILVFFITAGFAEPERADERTDAGGQWKYVLEDGGAIITGCGEEPSDDLLIPGKLDGYMVTGIGDGAFDGCWELKGVTIPEGVTNIGDRAFAGCRYLTGVTIPGSVKSIGNYAFDGCWELTGITIPEGVTSIGDWAFNGARIGTTRVTIPASATDLGRNLFGPMTDGPIFDGPWVDDGFSLAFIDVAPGNPRYEQIDGVLFDKWEKALVLYPAGRKGAYAIPEGTLRINAGAFSRCWNLTGCSIPAGCLSIGDRAFKICQELTCVVIPDGVTSIGNSTFSGCHNLTDVTIPSSVTHIGDYAFEWCDSMTGVIIPDSVRSIGTGAFYGCVELTSFTIPEGVINIGDRAFKEACNAMTRVTIPASAVNLGAELFGGLVSYYGYRELDWHSLTFIDVAPGNPRYGQIDGVLFDNREKALVLYPDARKGAYMIPDGTLRIDQGAFSDCWNLTGCSIPDGCLSIGDTAFKGCESLAGVEIPGSVTFIGAYAFAGCEKLSLTVTEGSFAERYARENGIPYVFATDARFAEVATLISDLTVNIRSGPGTEYAQIGEAYPGASFYYTGTTVNGFLEIIYPDINLLRGMAYVNKDLAEVSRVGAEDAVFSSVAGYLRVKPKTQVYFDALLSKKTKLTLGDNEYVPFAGVSSGGSYAVLYTTINQREERILWIGYISPKDVVEASALGE